MPENPQVVAAAEYGSKGKQLPFSSLQEMPVAPKDPLRLGGQSGSDYFANLTRHTNMCGAQGLNLPLYTSSVCLSV